MANTVKDVIEEIRRLNRMAELDPAKFAEEGGYADTLAREFGRDLKATQLRKVFGSLKQVDLRLKTEAPQNPLARAEINRLIPELAYAFGRNLVPREFYELMKMCLSQTKLQSVGDFQRLMEFLTAVLAYHKLHG